MTHFPACQSLLFEFLFIQMAVSSSTEIKRLSSMLSVVTLKQETMQLEMKFLKDDVLELREELHQARQQLDVLGGIINGTKMKDSGENKCSCETIANLTNELQDTRLHGINNSERTLKLESFSKQWAYEVQELKKISSTAKALEKGFRQEKQLRKDFEMRTDTRLFATNDIFNMNQTRQSSSQSKDNDSSIEKMNSSLHGLLVDVEDIKSSIRNIQNDTCVLHSTFQSQSTILANSSNTTRRNDTEIRQIYSELQSLKGVIANISGCKTSILVPSTTSSRTTTSRMSLTPPLCARMVTDETLILGSIKLGSRVVRGRDWAWGNQDGVPPTTGTVDKIDSLPGWVWVRWGSGMYVNYRVGEGSKFDLYICE
ncbi:hypothetical protein CHS0354_008991 [Potamilus streckersoni]|uniref:MIB/HERC2 domain-containing protein n=1 Tax=Potamilus streckersoni TaxID=2493646 RepID=A0AAE0TIH7_9BIVA|nr:hypothetical protein CHS0354_008991 [Potamilus streckersoni]